MVSFPFVFRIVRAPRNHRVLYGGKRRMTREQFEAHMQREARLTHIRSLELPGGYELMILRKLHQDSESS